jgi:hypothetical protein
VVTVWHLLEDESGGLKVGLCRGVDGFFVPFADEVTCHACRLRWWEVTGSWPIAWQPAGRRV